MLLAHLGQWLVGGLTDQELDQVKAQYRVAVHDPLPLVRGALYRALTDAGYRVEEVPRSVTAWVRRTRRSVVVFTLSGPRRFDRLDEILSASDSTKVVVLVDEPSPDVFASILQRSRSFPIPRHSHTQEVVEAVDCALLHIVRLPAAIAKTLADQATFGNGVVPPLESKELSWMNALAKGRTVHDVASNAGYSERAMYRKLAGIYRQLGVPNRSLAIARLAKAGLIEPLHAHPGETTH